MKNLRDCAMVVEPLFLKHQAQYLQLHNTECQIDASQLQNKYISSFALLFITAHFWKCLTLTFENYV